MTLYKDHSAPESAANNEKEKKTLSQFYGSAYPKHRIGAYGSGDICANGKRISRVSGEFWFLRMQSPCDLKAF